jgi:arginase family enzyme
LRISAEKLRRYRELAERPTFQVDEPELRRYFERAREQDAGLFSSDFSPNGMFSLPYEKDLTNVDLACLGIPLDRGVPFDRPGARLGPRAVRQWSRRYSYNDVTGLVPFEVCSAIDWGDVRFDRQRYDLESGLEAIAAAVTELKRADVVPFTVGGEHTQTWAILKALTRDGAEPVGVIHIDAHGDTAGMSGERHATDATVLTKAVVDGYVDPERTIQIGTRSRACAFMEPFARGVGMRVVRAWDVKDRGVASVVEEARATVGDGPAYITFDTDAIDPSEMPGTTLPDPFGLTGREARELLLGLRGVDVVGADLVELNPTYDPTGNSACLAAGLAFELVCLLAEARVGRTGRTRPTSWSAS